MTTDIRILPCHAILRPTCSIAIIRTVHLPISPNMPVLSAIRQVSYDPGWALSAPISIMTVCRKSSSAIFLTSRTGFLSNTARMCFQTARFPSGIAIPSRNVLKFAVVAADFDHDGLLDVLTADGHVRPEWEKWNKRAKFKEPMQLYKIPGMENFSRSPTCFTA